MQTRHRIAVLAIIGLLIGTPGVLAQENAPDLVDRIWSFTPRAGAGADFAKAFAAHSKWRTDNQDPWHWEAFVEVVGPHVGRYIVRTAGHPWSDFDDRDNGEFRSEADANWQATAAPLVEQTTGSITRAMADISNWPDPAPAYNLFQVNFYLVKPGQMGAFRQAAKALADTLKQAKWPHHWRFDEQISGGPVPTVLLVIPSLNWAGMAEPDPTVFQAVSNQVGEGKAAAMFKAFADTYDSIDSIVVQRLPQLAVPGKPAS